MEILDGNQNGILQIFRRVILGNNRFMYFNDYEKQNIQK